MFEVMSEVDDLLAELNSDALPPKPVAQPPKPASQPVAAPVSAKPKSAAAPGTVDDLLNDLDSVSGLPDRPALPKTSGSTATQKPQRVLKCSVATLCNPDLASQRCLNLLCTKCAFEVVWFENWKWNADVDYQFTRYYYPDLDRLRPRMTPEEGPTSSSPSCCTRSRRSSSCTATIRGGHVSTAGATAYLCQCTHETVRDVVNVGGLADAPRWVCQGH